MADVKPNSVPPRSPAGLDDHFSRAACASRSACAVVRLLPGNCPACAGRVRRPFPVLSCTAWGLSCPGACAPGGGLLPRLFTLTRGCSSRRKRGRFVFCDTFRRARLSPGAPAHFTRHAACLVFGLSSAGLAPRSDHLSATGCNTGDPCRRQCRITARLRDGDRENPLRVVAEGGEDHDLASLTEAARYSRGAGDGFQRGEFFQARRLWAEVEFLIFAQEQS